MRVRVLVRKPEQLEQAWPNAVVGHISRNITPAMNLMSTHLGDHNDQEIFLLDVVLTHRRCIGEDLSCVDDLLRFDGKALCILDLGLYVCNL